MTATEAEGVERATAEQTGTTAREMSKKPARLPESYEDEELALVPEVLTASGLATMRYCMTFRCN